MGKQGLDLAVECTRVEMRSLQGECETYLEQARSKEAQTVATQVVVVAARDKLNKINGQLRRARDQVTEHKKARKLLQTQLSQHTSDFREMLGSTAAACLATESDLEYLRQICSELEERIQVKAQEVETLRLQRTSMHDRWKSHL